MRKLVMGSWPELVERLQRVGLRHAPNLKPYESARILMQRVSIADLVPLSKYVLEDQLQIVDRLHDKLSAQNVDIFELKSGIVWPEGLGGIPISCPIVELWESEGLLLIDGIHRVWAARKLGRREVTCAVITGVAVPLVPLPVTWEHVKVFPKGQRPKEKEKRDYRFLNAASLRSAFPPVADKVTEKNFRYFLYRNLDELGSSGIRAPAAAPDSPTKLPDPESEEGNDRRP